MDKKKRNAIVSSVAAAFSIFALIVVFTGKYMGVRDPSDTSNIEWMSTIKDDAKLTDIVIPGSHDSGTTDMVYLGETECYSIKEQLEIGVRYFDIRANLKNDKLYIFHSIIIGQSFDGVISEFKSFLQEHPTETLILDAQHFENKAEYKVKELFENEFYNNDLVIDNTSGKDDLEFVSSLTLNDARGKALIFIGENDRYNIAEDNSWLMKRSYKSASLPKYSLESYYNKEEHCGSSKKFCEKTLPSYFAKIKEKEQRDGYKGMFVLQSQLTEGALIFGPWSRERGHDKNVSKYINDLPNKEYFSYTNVIMRDFVNEDKVNDIIKLNTNKGLLK